MDSTTQRDVAAEYAEHGIALIGANNDRAAGYARLLELMHVEPGRLAPGWAGVPDAAGGSPRLFIFPSCRNLIGQLQSAPVAVEGVIDPKWESQHGHAVACARYGAMSWPLPAKKPEDQGPEDPRARRIWELIRERDEGCS